MTTLFEKTFVATAGMVFCAAVSAANNPFKIQFSTTPTPEFMAASTAMTSLLTGTPGALDPSFDLDGVLQLNFGGSEEVSDLAVQPDGKIVAVGHYSANLFVARFNPDGSYDTTFNGGGAFSIGGYNFANGYAMGVTLQGDKIVIATSYDYLVNGTTYSNAYVARFDAYGNPDITFGSNGVFTRSYGQFTYIEDVLIDSSNRIVLGGNVSPNTNHDFLIARLTSNGAVDTSFGLNGYRTTGFSTGSNDIVSTLKFQSDGKIVAAGHTYTGTTAPNWALARYTTSGALDSTFGYSGKTTIDFFGSTDVANDLEIQPDNKLVILGGVWYPSGNTRYMAMIRTNANATSFDTTFNGNGQIYFGNWSNQTDIYPTKLRRQADGKIDAAATIDRTTGRDFALYRVNANGTFDTTFGGGAYIYDVGGSETLHDFIIQPDGELLTGGGINNDLLLTRHFN